MSAGLERLLAYLKANEYQDLRVLEDGTIIGTIELMFTRALCVDLDGDGWGQRYCYEDRELAVTACYLMESGDDQPLTGYVANRIAKRIVYAKTKTPA